jgi:tripartite-type tricarboxylate transporter receptor subunit TctC
MEKRKGKKGDCVMNTRFKSIVAVLVLPLAILVSSALAQNFPNKPIRLVVPMAPGGAVDVTARIYAQKLTENLGQPVLVDNQPGGGGSLAPGIVTKAAPDGYTLLYMSQSSLYTTIVHKLPYDMPGDFAPITLTDEPRAIIAASPSLPAKSMQELIELAKAKPGKLTFASDGIGSSAHLTMELFKKKEGIDMLHIPYKGQGPAMIDMMAGRVDVKSCGIIAVIPHIRSGKLKALAITGDKRSSAAPEITTLVESGITYWHGSWKGFLAPAATPKEIVQKLNAEIVKVLNSPDIKGRLAKDGIEVVGNSPEQFAAFLKEEKVTWTKMIKEAGIRLE